VAILIDAADLSASRPNRPLFADVSLTLSDGDRLGVVGINGCGKSTLLRMLAGDANSETGVVRYGRGARIGFLHQLSVLPDTTVRDAVGHGWQGEAILDRLGMAGLIDAPTTQLSGGQAKRVALAQLLAGEHEVLILDEPTNHLDLDAIAFLEERLATFPGGLILVTHDRHVLDRVTNKVLELDRGKAYLHVPSSATAGSGYAAYLNGRAEREEHAIVAEQTRKVLARKELAWLRRGAPARTRKPKAHIASALAIVNGRPQAAARSGELGLSLGTSRLGSKAVELHDLSFTWPDGVQLLKPFSHMLEPGDRLGIVGGNGTGKSTLLDLLAGRRQPSSGRIERGKTVVLGYYDQLGRDLDLKQRVREAVAGPHKTEPTLEDKQLMERFWFDPIGTLSGGERRRLQLLLTLVDQPNVLMLDEPTNDLDLDTLRALEDFLEDWPGALVVVSHDRAFVDRTVEEVLALDGDGGASLVRGGVAGWLASRATAGKGNLRDTRAGTRVAQAPAGDLVTGGARGESSPQSVAPQQTKSARSPSTLRRLMTQVERELAQATEKRDGILAKMLDAGSDHLALAKLGEELGTAELAVAAAEERWIDVGAEAESIGLSL
jgi:ABC transport system ATP-binding/permease protein